MDCSGKVNFLSLWALNGYHHKVFLVVNVDSVPYGCLNEVLGRKDWWDEESFCCLYYIWILIVVLGPILCNILGGFWCLMPILYLLPNNYEETHHFFCTFLLHVGRTLLDVVLFSFSCTAGLRTLVGLVSVVASPVEENLCWRFCITRSVHVLHAIWASFLCCRPSQTVCGPNWNVVSPSLSTVGVLRADERNFFNVVPVFDSFSSLIDSIVAYSSGVTFLTLVHFTKSW